MTTFTDINGLTGIEAIKLDGASTWIGTSANIAAIDTTNMSSYLFSITNYSVNSQIFDSTETTAAVIAKTLTRLIAVLDAKGILDEDHLGTGNMTKT